MLEDRDYMRRPSSRTNWSATIALVAALVAAFLFQITLLRHFPNAEYNLMLSLDGIRHGFVWELLTFQFMHGGWIHLLVNCWALFMFGREVEWALGKPRFFTLYFLGGVVGGLFQLFVSWMWPDSFGGPVVGASAGIFGVVAAFARLDPDRELMMLLYFVIPLRMRARTLLLFLLALTGAGLAFPASIFGGNIAHAAHLGGIVVGYLFTWIVLRRPEMHAADFANV